MFDTHVCHTNDMFDTLMMFDTNYMSDSDVCHTNDMLDTLMIVTLNKFVILIRYVTLEMFNEMFSL